MHAVFQYSDIVDAFRALAWQKIAARQYRILVRMVSKALRKDELALQAEQAGDKFDMRTLFHIYRNVNVFELNIFIVYV